MYDNLVSSAFIMSESHSPIIRDLLNYYENNRASILVPNNNLYTSFLKERYPNFLLNNKMQKLEDGVYIYPKEYFECPTFSKIGGFAVHHFAASWRKQKLKWLRNLFNLLRFYIPLLDLYLQVRGRKHGYYLNEFYKQAEIDRFK